MQASVEVDGRWQSAICFSMPYRLPYTSCCTTEAFLFGYSISEQLHRIQTEFRTMDVSLAPLYYGLLVILSIFFYNVAEEGSLIDEGQKLYQLLNEKKDIIRENIVETFQQEPSTKEKVSYFGSLPFFQYLKENSYLYNKILFIFDTLKKGALEYLNGHPEIGQYVSKAWSSIHDYSELVYSTCEERVVFLANKEPVKSYIAEYAKLHDTYVTPYVEKASDTVSGAIVQVIDFIKKQTSEDLQNDEIVYTFLVTVVGVFILKASFTRLLRCFAKDAFQMNRSISEMYKQQLVKDMIKDGEKHSDVYLEIKEDTLTDYNMTVDDVEEMEKEYGVQNASNRRQKEQKQQKQQKQQQQQQQQRSKASNRTRSKGKSSSESSSEFGVEAESKFGSEVGARTKFKIGSEEKGRQRPEEINELTEGSSIEDLLLKAIIDEASRQEEMDGVDEVDEVVEIRPVSASPCVTTKSSKTFKSSCTDRSDSTESSIANTTYTTTSVNTANTTATNNAGTRLVYISSGSLVYGEDDALLKESFSGLSSSAVSGVTLAVDDDVHTAPIASSGGGGDDSLCESVRSLLV